jgi:hypothetical protein
VHHHAVEELPGINPGFAEEWKTKASRFGWIKGIELKPSAARLAALQPTGRRREAPKQAPIP